MLVGLYLAYQIFKLSKWVILSLGEKLRYICSDVLTFSFPFDYTFGLINCYLLLSDLVGGGGGTLVVNLLASVDTDGTSDSWALGTLK